MRRKTSHTGSYMVAGAGAFLVGGLAIMAGLSPDEIGDKRHCSLKAAPHTTLVVALDTSDPLVAGQPRSITYAIDQELSDLVKGDRIVAIDAAGKPPTEVPTVVDQRHPGDNDNIARNAFRAQVMTPIQKHLFEIQSRQPSDESPLIGTVLAIVADHSLNVPGTHLRIDFVTDGLQNSKLVSAYRTASQYPAVSGRPLAGVVVKLILVMNQHDLALQPAAVERLTEWFKAAGAVVIYTEPAWMALARAEHRNARQ